MRRPRYIEFVCLRGHRIEWLLETNDDGSPIYEMLHDYEVKPMCLTCHLDNKEGGINIETEEMVPVDEIGIGYAQTINRNNSDFAERQRERLEKRSREHWQKKGRDEAVDRQRALEKKYGA